jgi:hypothetical protein
MSKKSYGLKWERREWVVFFTVVVIATAAIVAREISAPKGDITGTVSKAEPPIKRDGTSAHPYADASQCPPSTNLIFWPNGRSIPSIPRAVSVCFVGDESLNKGGPNLEVRDR